MHFSACVFVHFTLTGVDIFVNIKIPVCQTIRPAAAWSAGPVRMPGVLARRTEWSVNNDFAYQFVFLCLTAVMS